MKELMHIVKFNWDKRTHDRADMWEAYRWSIWGYHEIKRPKEICLESCRIGYWHLTVYQRALENESLIER